MYTKNGLFPMDLANAYYSRQIRVPEVGAAGQARLCQASVLVFGAGGLGSPVLQYLCGAGVGRICIVDPDTVSVSNLHRQTLYAVSDVEKPKVTVAQQRLQAMNPDVSIVIVDTPVQTLAELAELGKEYDLWLDCTDDWDIKFLLNQGAYTLNKPVLFGSVYQWEGQLFWTDPAQPDAACFNCLWPATSTPPACSDTGILGPTTGIVGSWMALEAIKQLLCLSSRLSAGVLFLIQGLSNTVDSLFVEKRSNCSVCGAVQNDIQATRSQESAIVPHITDFQLSCRDIASFDDFVWVALEVMQYRDEAYRWLQETLGNALLSTPLERFEHTALDALSQKKPVVLVCPEGIQSSLWVKRLRKQGVQNIYSLEKGVGGLQAAFAKR